MLALGIDPGTRNLGWGLVERSQGRLLHVAHGVIRVDAKLHLAERLCKLADGIDEVIRRHQPTLGSVEQLFFHKDPQAAAKLGHARGVVLLGLGRHGIDIVEHTPARVKRTITGNGQATKAQVAQMVKAILGMDDAMPEDASDALAIAITGLRITASPLAGASASNRRTALPAHVRERMPTSTKTTSSRRAEIPAHLEPLLAQVRLRRA
jgi:crossover junction endodeoxyribonuclease RuvC